MDERYEARTDSWLGEPAVLLRDGESDAEALVAPGCGANCVAFSVMHSGRRMAVLETPPTPDDLKSRRFRAGIPVLFPFPGRLRNARYNFGGREYTLPATDRGGVHHIHGVVNAVAWRVADQGAAAAGAFLACRISDQQLAPEMRAGYPFPFEATLRFTLTGTQLSLLFTLENLGSEPLPFGYGLHPYFRAPLWDGTEALPLSSERSGCLVQIPAASRWPLEGSMPSGPAQPVSPEDDLRQWRELGPEHFDHIFSDLTHQNGWSSAGYRDPSSGLEVSVRADQHFREWVLYTQPNRPSLCIEPYTCLPNAANMASEGIDNGGLLTLEPGQIWRAEVVIETRSM